MTETCTVCGLPLEIGERGCVYTIRPHEPFSVSVVDDSYPGGKVLKNVAHEDITVYSRSEERIVLKQHGVIPFVRHVGEPGSDKSRHTTRWI